MANEEVAQRSALQDEMAKRWRLPATLMGGTAAMRAAGDEFLPKDPKESEGAYRVRLDRSTLFNGFRRSVKNLQGKVFSREIVLNKDVPEPIVEWSENIDLSGRHLNQVAADIFKDGLVHGLSHILVETPVMPKGLSLAQERSEGLRPYWVHIEADRVLGTRSAVINGVPTLTQIRINEDLVEADGEFGEVEKHRVRVIDRGTGESTGDDDQTGGFATFRIFEQTEGGDWEEVDHGTLRGMVDIPLATFYTERLAFMSAVPPLEDLAWVNTAHWQSSSDQRNILHVARVPLLFGTGLPDDEDDLLIIGPNRLITAPQGAELGYVEHEGKAIDAGRHELQDLEEQMELLGLEPLVSKPGQVTATERAIDTAEAHSTLQAWAISLGDAIEQANGFMARWAAIGESGGSVKVNTDYGVSARDAKDVENLIKMRLAADISRDTLWAELRRRNVLSDEFDPAEELRLIEEEGPPPGSEDDEDDSPPLGGEAEGAAA